MPVDPDLGKVQLQSDDMYMYLDTGDATMQGNVRASGVAERHRGSVEFPPEIIK